MAVRYRHSGLRSTVDGIWRWTAVKIRRARGLGRYTRQGMAIPLLRLRADTRFMRLTERVCVCVVRRKSRRCRLECGGLVYLAGGFELFRPRGVQRLPASISHRRRCADMSYVRMIKHMTWPLEVAGYENSSCRVRQAGRSVVGEGVFVPPLAVTPGLLSETTLLEGKGPQLTAARWILYYRGLSTSDQRTRTQTSWASRYRQTTTSGSHHWEPPPNIVPWAGGRVPVLAEASPDRGQGWLAGGGGHPSAISLSRSTN